MQYFRFFATALIIFFLISAQAALAQTGGPAITLVALDDSAFPSLTLRLSVVGPDGRPITGLTSASIEILEDGAPAKIVSVQDVADTAQAIAVVIVIDTSDSMAGAPLAAAKESAMSFVNRLGPDDQVAVLAFGSSVREAQAFTTDKAQAQVAIESLETSGATALYDAANQGVLTAARSALTRRIVVLLGDGAEYGGASLSQAGDAYQAARANGVTIHTIALGFSADTDYFQQLSGLTGGAALNAPTPAELDAQWASISTLMRQLVEVVVRSNAPGDGQTHSILVRVKTGGGQTEVTGTFQSKPVAPTVTLKGLESGATLKNVTTITANVGAQGQVTGVTFSVDGNLLSRDTDSPFTAELDPASLSAGAHTLTVEAADQTGTTGSAEMAFNVSAVPPTITLSLIEGQTIDAPLSLTPNIVSQSESNTVTISIDGRTTETLDTPPYRFTLDPAKLGSGAHTLAVTVTDANGESASAEVGFTVVSASTPGGGSMIGIIAIAAVVIVVVVAAVVVAARRKPAAPAAPPAPALRLEVTSGPDAGKVFPLTDEKQLIGRLSTAPISLTDPTGGLHVSREHARVWKTGGMAYIEDAGSRYGVIVNGAKITEPTAIPNGASIRIGEVEMVFHGPAPTAGDLRATQLGVSMIGTLIADEESKPAPKPDRTMLVEDAKPPSPPASTVFEPPLQTAPEKAEEAETRLKRESDEDDNEQRHTRLKSEGEAKVETQEAEDESLRGTRLSAQRKRERAEEDDEELRHTRLKDDEDDDEGRETRLKA